MSLLIKQVDCIFLLAFYFFLGNSCIISIKSAADAMNGQKYSGTVQLSLKSSAALAAVRNPAGYLATVTDACAVGSLLMELLKFSKR